jgi:acyl-coenzyme A synthetase/AMP-(fatty) acid ligase
MAREPGFGEQDVLLAVTTLSFDIAGLEIFLPLTTGARLVMVDRVTASDGHLLSSALTASGATVLQATPSTWRMLLDTGWPGGPKLRALCGGEALSGELAARLMGKCESLWNLYGPTETTIWSSVHRVENASGTIPIGRPIANTQLHILDGHGQVTPIGVPGELSIGGDGVARGYLNAPDLTAERFVADPVRGRLYRTGDLVRRRADGQVEFLGRIDNQVKLRGFRIELGEVESALERHHQVRQAVAALREVAPGDDRLIAYVVVYPHYQLDEADLREFLKEKLPGGMIPSTFVVLDALPSTRNGKVDRKALPLPVDAGAKQGAGFVAPTTPLEQTLAEIWAAALAAPRVGLNDDFFAMGGHSLLANQVITRIRDSVGVDLPTRLIFEAPTIAEMVQAIDQMLLDDVADDEMASLLAELEEGPELSE